MKNILILCVALSYSSISMAQEEPNWYIGAGAGKANFDAADFSESDTFFSISGGYVVTELFSVEASYVDLGSVSSRLLPNDIISLIQDTLSIDASGFVVTSKFSWEFANSLDLSAKVGISVIDIDKRWSGGTVVDERLANDTGGTEAELFLGVQIQYQVSEQYSIELNLDRYKVEEIDVDGVYVKVNFHF